LALTEFAAETSFPTIAHHRALSWEHEKILLRADYWRNIVIFGLLQGKSG
jgi:hypothetical protein